MSTTRTRKNRLSKMRLDFVSLVPAGDDPMAQVVISKAAPEPNKQEDDMGDAISKDDLDPEVVAYIEGLEAEVDDLTKASEDLTEKVEGLEKSLKEAEDSGLIVKSEEEQVKALLEKADPAVRVMLEKQEQELERVRKAAEAERDARLDREFLSKAEALPNIEGERSALGSLLRRISEALSPEDSAEVEKMLATANARLEKSALFEEFGTGGQPTTISKSVEAKAEELRKAEPTLTMEQAIAKAYEENPSLLAEAMTEEVR